MDQLHFDARTLPPDEAFDRWRVGVTDFDLTLAHPQAGFSGRSTVTPLGPMIVSESDLPAVRFHRPRAMILADGHDAWSLSLVLTGGMDADADGASVRIEPGEIALFTHSRPVDIRTQAGRTIVLFIPADLLAGLDGWAVHGRLPDSAATGLLADFLKTLAAALPALDPAAALPTARALVALIHGAAGGEPTGPASRRAQSLRAQAIVLVEARLENPLAIEGVCDRLAVSRSALYRALARDGGLRPLVKRLRLQAAQRFLADPADRRTIQEIAGAVGYTDGALFSRHFQAAFGTSAAAFRTTATLPPPIPPDSEDIPRDFARATERLAAGPNPA